MTTNKSLQSFNVRAIMMLLALFSTSTAWSLVPLNNDTWDASTGQLTVNSNLKKDAYSNKQEIKSIKISKDVTEIGDNAFYYCKNLTTIIIDGKSQLKKVGAAAFNSTGISWFHIPAHVESFNSSTLANCPNLTKIEVSAQNNFYKSVDGVLYSIDGKTLLTYPCGKNGSSYTIPEGVTTVDDDAFNNCTSLTDITLPTTLEEIGMRAFFYCKRLQTIVLPSALKRIEYKAFFGTALTEVTIPASLTLLDRESFGSSSIESLSFEDGIQLKTIGDHAFFNCKLESLTIPEGITTIDQYAFSECTKLTKVIIPSSVTSICHGAFRGCFNLRTIFVHADTPPAIEGEIFSNPVTGRVFYVLKESEELYQTAWDPYFNNSGHKYLYAVKVEISPSEAGTIVGYGYYEEGSTATLTAQDGQNHYFLNWSENGEVVCTDPTYSFAVTNNHNLTANYKLNESTYTLQFPDVVTLNHNAEWTTVSVKVTNIRMYMLPNGYTPNRLRVIVEGGTLKNQENNAEISYKLSVDQSTLFNQRMLDWFPSDNGKENTFYINVSSSILNTAAPGVYTGTFKYYTRWSYTKANGSVGWSTNLVEGYIPVTLTIPQPITTSITTVEPNNGEEVWYTVDGHRLLGKPTTKGVFIKNGRKVIL